MHCIMAGEYSPVIIMASPSCRCRIFLCGSSDYLFALHRCMLSFIIEVWK